MLFTLGNLSGSRRIRLRRAGVLAVASVLIAASAVARAGDASSTPTVALAYDKGTQALFKSDGQALYRSADEGRTWEPIRPPADRKGKVYAIATPAGGDGVLYVAGPELGVLRTENGGALWTVLGEGLPSANVTALTAHSTQPDTLYAYLPDSGIHRSQDAGKSWKLMDRGPEGMNQLIHSSMAGSMESGWLYAATEEGVQLAMDCFCFWRDAGEIGGAVQAVAFDPAEPKRVYAASEQGIHRSVDGGQVWEAAATPGSEVTSLIVAPSSTLFAGTRDGTLYRSTDQAAIWERAGE